MAKYRMDYKEKYERGLECIQEILSGASDTIKTSILQKRLQPFFPELQESEDEEIRERLKHYLEVRRCQTKDNEEYINCNHFLKWLEKQGNILKEVTCTQEVEVGNGNIKALVTEEMSINKNKPKFHEGEYIINGDYTWKVIKVQELNYILQSQDGNTVDDNIFYVDKYFHLWTLQDAKDGDILACDDKDKVFLYNGKFDLKGRVCAYCGIYKTHDGLHFTKCAIGNYFTYKDPHPATKEQRDLLFQKMHESGYEWNADKKELKKLSNEDELIKNDIISYLRSEKIVKRYISDIEFDKWVIWLEKQGEQNPYSGISFKYNGHTWGMCARDGGVEILIDSELKTFVSLNELQSH